MLSVGKISRLRMSRQFQTRLQKITFGEMRAAGVRGILVYCADYRCSHSSEALADRWADDVRLSDIEPRFVCAACGKCGADVRPNFHWSARPVSGHGFLYR